MASLSRFLLLESAAVSSGGRISYSLWHRTALANPSRSPVPVEDQC